MLRSIPKLEGIESGGGGDVFHDVFDDGVALSGAGRPAVRVGRRVRHHRVRHDLPRSGSVAVLREGRSSVDGRLVEAVAAVAIEPDAHGFEVAVSVHCGLVSAIRFEKLETI